MGVVVIVLLAALWASILLPSAVRSRRNTSPLDSISAFERSMSKLAPLRPPAAPGREVLVLDRPRTVTGRAGSARVLARRRANLAGLAALVVVAAVAAVALRGPYVWGPVVAGAWLVGYVAVLRSRAARAADARLKIRRLAVPAEAERDLAAPAASRRGA